MIEIRSERPKDAAAVRQVNEKAFGGPKEARLVEMLRAADRVAISLVALSNDQLVGHILFSPITVAEAPAGFVGLALAPLAVLPAFQKLGIGSRLIRHGLTECLQGGCQAVVVLGSPGYYSRFGFTRASDHQLDNEYHAHEEFMVLELVEGTLDTIRGLVKYAPEFRESGC
jgi:putative acetyltransferase